ncbi:hypothetical protein FGO68_gene1229 [Halteria grandinella]|uniref:TRP C-terminal domain-containing protein n=1 Tax=Halteria grandinella TaxID=5974 RepID=A0A8J8T9K5_HALGN|nr:hypothetical protein FGO68_gene1229 [Halteria grandinella]
MNLIWSMMNDLSFLISLGLVSIPIPGIASPIQSLLSTIIYMDVLLTDEWLSALLENSIKPSEMEDDSPVNLFLESQGFKSKLLLQNLGSTLVFLLIQIFLLLYTGMMWLLRSASFLAEKQYQFLSARLLWGSTIRFLIQQFQPLLFASLINIRSFSHFRSQPPRIIFNYSLSVAIFAFILLSIIGFYVIIKKGKATENKFATLIEGTKSYNSGFSSFWTVWTLAKWSLMCFVLVLLTDYPAQQLQLLLALSIFSTTLQFKVQPFASKIENSISLFNELMASFYIYALIGLASTSNNILLRKNLGLVLIAILLLALFINLLKVIIQIGISLFKKISEKCCPSNNKSTVIKKKIKKYAMTTIKEEKQEEDEDVFDRQLKSLIIIKKKNNHNETQLPKSFSRSMQAQDITLQELG